MTDAVNTAMSIRNFLSEIGFNQGVTQCYEDNTGTIDWVKKQRSNTRMKHIEVKYHVLRQQSDKKNIELVHIDTKLQRADSFTKQMDFAVHNPQMGLLYSL